MRGLDVGLREAEVAIVGSDGRTRSGAASRRQTRRFKALVASAGLPDQRFHDLRHACASLLLAQGVAPRVVMETLGHSQISLTLNTYSHVIPALGRDAADRMELMLRPVAAERAA